MSTDLADSRGRPAWFVSADEFLDLPDTRGLELSDGAIVLTRRNNRTTWVAGQVHAYLRDFVSQRDLGWVLPPNTLLRCDPQHPDRLRRPSAAYVDRRQSPAFELRDTGYTSVVPALVVEVVSSRDSAYRVERKLVGSLAAGVRLTWVVYAGTRTAYAHSLAGTIARLIADDHLDGLDVLPGFRVRLSDILPPVPPAA